MAIIRSGNRNQAAAIIQGGLDMNTVHWLRESNNRLASSGASGEMHDLVMQSSAIWLSDESIQETNELMRRYAVSMDLDTHRLLTDLLEFQSAKPYMRKYIMANPVLKQSWLDGEAEGYDGEFEQREVNAVGEDDYFYRSVMNGMEQEDGDFYRYDTYDDCEELSHEDQLEIGYMWQHTNYLMEIEEDDPSSVLGNSL